MHQDRDANDNSYEITEADEVNIDIPARNLDMSVETEPKNNCMAEISVDNISNEDLNDHSDRDDSA